MNTTKKNILVLFAHPALQKSRVNRVLLNGIHGLEGVTLRDLYEEYPELDIDIQREQASLAENDIVVLQHPFFWYSTPAMLKEWMDLVLEHGWAYGKEGTALHGKMWLNVVTTGGREVAYQRGGYNRFTMRELLAPIEQTARLCGMDFLPPFVVHGTHGMTNAEMADHATDYRRALDALRHDRIDMTAARECSRLNENLDLILKV